MLLFGCKKASSFKDFDWQSKGERYPFNRANELVFCSIRSQLVLPYAHLKSFHYEFMDVSIFSLQLIVVSYEVISMCFGHLFLLFEIPFRVLE